MSTYELNYQLLFESSPEVLLVLLPDTPRFTMVAATQSRLAATHLTREQTIGRGLFEVFPDNPDDPAATGMANLRASLGRVLATRDADTMAVQKYDIRMPDGSFAVKHWSPKNIPVLSPDGEILYILHRVEDITELVQAAEEGRELRGRAGAMEREVINRSRELADAIGELRQANIKLGELDAAKTAFFSNISHEFRTPLTLMLGPVEDALTDTDEPLGARQRRRMQLAHDNALRLFKLVNALLDFSRLEAGRLHASFAPLDVSGFTAELAGMFRSAVEKTNIELIVDCPPLTEPVWVDRDMWEKIVPNLVSNALKFTHAGHVAVRVRQTATQVSLEVSDTGIGIAPDQLPRIFERFHRVPGAQSRTHEGTGIGLSLVRELVELHGGQITAQSEVGRGTTFRVALLNGHDHLPSDAVSHKPLNPRIGRDAAAHAAEAARWDSATSVVAALLDDSARRGATPKSKQARDKVLVVDDSADLRDYITTLLEPNYEVATATDGEAALDSLRRQVPAMVISDVMMPRLDGIGLLRAMRADPALASVPVILLSARAGEESAIDGLNAGSDDYLVKPFSARELLARVRTHVELSRMRRDWIAELERANRELDAFSYSVSHDLRAPLRAIDGFSRALQEECGADLDATALTYVEKIRNGTARMALLINALLDLARISRASLQRQHVDLSARAAAVAEDLARSHPERHAAKQVRVDIEEGLSVQGDPELLDVVLVNLIGNAWKFTAQRDRAWIRVGRFASDPPTFFVRDNGAGFDMEYASQLFEPFRRLHDAREYSGTGVGLATVQRAIARHGGRVWTEGKVNQGATFFFSLPDQDQ